MSATKLLDPATFATDLAVHIVFNLDQCETDPNPLDFIAGAERTAFEDAERRTIAAMPDLATAGVDHPFSALQESVQAFANAMYDAGVRHGAAIEALRRELVHGQAGAR